jgi:hypothetical protein
MEPIVPLPDTSSKDGFLMFIVVAMIIDLNSSGILHQLTDFQMMGVVLTCDFNHFVI